MRLAAYAALFLVCLAPPHSGATSASQAAGRFAGVLDEHPAIQYAVRPTRDPVASLDQSLNGGQKSLAYREAGGYLQSALDALRIPAESQLLVFSKTGIQRRATSPRNPRAIFFNDSTVVGYIPGARYLELAAHDPQQGVVFYTIDQTITSKTEITRRTDCLNCHVSGSTSEVPGLITRSMFTDENGDVMPQLGSFVVDHRTPLPHRWGGWFVTGNYVTPPYGGISHMGNVTTTMHPTSGPATTSNEVLIAWLNSAPVSRGYHGPDSDIAALMVFDHQRHAVNLLTRLNWEARVAEAEGAADFARGPLSALVHTLVDYLLFVDEEPPPARVTPRAGFAERFTATGKRDKRGRSLRELNLTTRLLQYRCSYMIDTVAFEQLPTAAKQAVYRRLYEVLSARDTAAPYAHLSPDDRRTIFEILRETKPDLPESFQSLVP
jgi:hypothetical protein